MRIWVKFPYEPEFETTIEAAMVRVASREINPAEAYAWHEGLTEWVFLTSLIPLPERARIAEAEDSIVAESECSEDNIISAQIRSTKQQNSQLVGLAQAFDSANVNVVRSSKNKAFKGAKVKKTDESFTGKTTSHIEGHQSDKVGHGVQFKSAITILPPPPNDNAFGVPWHPSPVSLRAPHGGLIARKPVARSGKWIVILVCLLALAGIKLNNYRNVCSEQQKRKEQVEMQRQEQPTIKQDEARKQQENIQKQKRKEQAILHSVEKINKENEQWDSMISNATLKKPFINSLGMPFARVSGTRFLISINPVSKSELAKSHDPSLNDISSKENSLREAVDFCAWLSYAENQNYHLPSDEEWEAVVKSGILGGNIKPWVWSSETASLRDAFCSVGDVKVLRVNSFKYINRKETPDDVVIHCILAPKM